MLQINTFKNTNILNMKKAVQKSNCFLFIFKSFYEFDLLSSMYSLIFL